MYYAALIVCLIAIYMIPWAELPFGSRVVGTLLAGAYGFPIFFAGVIFTESFRRCEDKSEAFGSNIVGAVAGGLAQNVSFVIGLKPLLLLAVVFLSLIHIFWISCSPLARGAPPQMERRQPM